MTQEITTENVGKIDAEELRSYCFSMIDLHVDLISLDLEKFTYLLGYYPAIYNYFAELYTYLIGEVRKSMELNDRFRTARLRDKRDVLEEALKSTKLQYESISRKITILSPNAGRGDVV